MVAFLTALRGLGANKLRSALTMLGVIIGVGAVIIAIAIGQGSQEAVAQSIERLGTNVLTIFPGQQRQGAANFGFGSIQTLTTDDADAIVKECPAVAAAFPQVQRNQQVVNGDRNELCTVYGVGVDYPSVANHHVQEGRFFTAQDIRGFRRVAAIGSTSAQTLFDTEDPVGKYIRIRNEPFLIIALLAPKGGFGFRNPDDAVYVPYTTAMRRLFGATKVQAITVQARSESLMNTAQDEIEALLMKRHNIPAEGNPDFIIFSQAEFAQTQAQQQSTFSMLITYLAIVSLIVGGIGIMNIMLVSVTERTREIGIRKAIGAKRRDVLMQFLLEALFLSLVGGLVGVLTGVSGAYFVGKINNWMTAVSPTTVGMAFSFSAIVGVFFGFYPALKASHLNPIDALRYE